MSSIDPFNTYLQYHSKEPDDTYMNPGLYSNSVVDSYLETALRSTDQSTAEENWKLAAYNGNTGYGPAGDAPWCWLVSSDILYLVKDDLDIGTPPENHGSDILINIYEWKRNSSS